MNRIKVAVVLMLTSLPAAATTTVFINELHYDNAGVDVGEGVELAGRAGTVLDGWTLLMYNGSDGGVYRTIELNGTLQDQSDGFGFLFFDTGALQNGPDGLALIDAQGLVQQFLSYEGAFVATDGAASGLTSSEIPVAENADTLAGFSLGLVGSGAAFADFSWTSGMQSFGSINSGQDFAVVPLPAGLPLLVGATCLLFGYPRKYIRDGI